LASHLPDLKELGIYLQGRPDASWLDTVCRFKSLRILDVVFTEGSEMDDISLAQLLHKMPGLLVARMAFVVHGVFRPNTPSLSGQPCALLQVRLNFNYVSEDFKLYSQKVCSYIFFLILSKKHFCELVFKPRLCWQGP